MNGSYVADGELYIAYCEGVSNVDVYLNGRVSGHDSKYHVCSCAFICVNARVLHTLGAYFTLVFLDVRFSWR